MRRVMTVLMGMWIPALCWAKCPSVDIARTVFRDVSQGANPGSYLTESKARRYRIMTYDHLEEIREPGHSMPELLRANRPDMGKIDLTGGTDTDITHRREPWNPYASVLWSADWMSPLFTATWHV